MAIQQMGKRAKDSHGEGLGGGDYLCRNPKLVRLKAHSKTSRLVSVIRGQFQSQTGSIKSWFSQLLL